MTIHIGKVCYQAMTEAPDEKRRVISPAQVRAARAWLSWSQQELAKRAGLSTGSISSFECGGSKAHDATATRLRETLEAAGVEFQFHQSQPIGIGGPTETVWKPRVKPRHRHLILGD